MTDMSLMAADEFWSRSDRLDIGNEAEVEQRLLLPMLRALGYADEEITPKAPIIFQEGRKGRPHEADFVVHEGHYLNEDTTLIVVEAKAPGQDLKKAATQAASYAQASKAPFLMLTDGKLLEIWQLQPTRRSDRVFFCAADELRQHRGEIERLIGRNSAIAHCRALGYRQLARAAEDVGAYVENELARMSEPCGVSRRLRIGNTTIDAMQGLNEIERGAVVFAPSGFGKTTLARDVHRHWLSTLTDAQPLPFLVPLPDLAEFDLTPENYARDRLAARCPHFGSAAAFADLIEKRGIRLLCDGLDRIDPKAQRRFLARADTLRRDRPKTRIIVLGRTGTPGVTGLPSINLLSLDRSEKQALASKVRPGRGAMAIHDLPPVLEPLSEHPLLLTLLLMHEERTGALPIHLDEVFETWLRSLLEVDGHGPAMVTSLRDLLGRFAMAVAGGSRPRRQVLAKVNVQPNEPLDDLVRTGALISGDAVEIVHDALGDYLRAELLLELPPSELAARLADVDAHPGSLLPPLLLSKCQDPQQRAVIWDRLGLASLATYLNALRFGGEPIDPQKVEEPELTAAFLHELRAGIVQPARWFMSPLEHEIYSVLTWRPTQTLGIAGTFDVGKRWFSYRLFEAAPGEQVVVSAELDSNGPVAGFNVETCIGGRNARRMAFDRLRDALAKVILRRRLRGGPVWTNERLLGRMRFALRQWRLELPLGIDFDRMAQLLREKRGDVLNLGASGERNFTTEDILSDIKALREWGWVAPDPWWEAYPASTGQTAVTEGTSGLLSEYWRRSQIVLDEVVRESFPKLVGGLNLHSAMPVRYRVRMHPPVMDERGMEFTWTPVPDWSSAAADVEDADGRPTMYDKNLFTRTMAELESLGRTGTSTISYVQGVMPRFDGTHRNHYRFDGETAVLRNALALLVDDLDHLLDRLPGRSLKGDSLVGA